MRRLIIDCITGKQAYEELTPEEETARLKEIEDNRIEAEARAKVEAKGQLVRELAELREMKQNRDVFSQDDIDERQRRVDELRGRI